MRPNWIAIGALAGGIAVFCAAYGEHALRRGISEGDFAVWEKAVRYQLVHALALIQFGTFSDARTKAGRAPRSFAGWAFLLGIVLFCGTLYTHALGAPDRFLHVAPLGGLAMIVGWIAFALAAVPRPE
jgi:uncharacterized membrane protein YgdD (TMEM256/DUF423 family)